MASSVLLRQCIWAHASDEVCLLFLSLSCAGLFRAVLQSPLQLCRRV